MGCAKIFDWVIQSTDHTRYALEHFPITAELVANARGRTDVGTLYEQLTEDEKAQYHGEQQEWQKLHGIPWESLGCPPERYVDEHTGRARLAGASASVAQPARSDVAAVQKALTERGYRTGNTVGLWDEGTCAAVYKYRRERLSDYGSRLNATFFMSLGFSSRVANSYALQFEQMCAQWYTSQVPPARGDIQGIQQALMNKGYNPGATDGLVSAKTVTALRAFQHARTGSSSDVISKDTFKALGYDDGTATVLASRYGDLDVGEMRLNSPAVISPAPMPQTPAPPMISRPTAPLLPTSPAPGVGLDEDDMEVDDMEVEGVEGSKFPIVPAAFLGLGLVGLAVYLAGRGEKK